MSENTPISPKPKTKGDYLEHRFINGISVHATDPLLSEHFIAFHMDELIEIVKREIKNNRKK